MRFWLAAHPRLLRLTKGPLTRLVMASDGVKKRDVVAAFSSVNETPAAPNLNLDSARRLARRQQRKSIAKYLRQIGKYIKPAD